MCFLNKEAEAGVGFICFAGDYEINMVQLSCVSRNMSVRIMWIPLKEECY